MGLQITLHLKSHVNCFPCPSINPTRGVSHCSLAVSIKNYLKAKEELWKLKYFTIQSSKKSCKRNQIPSRYYNSITNLKFQHKPKYHLSKVLIQK
jgi:hypothetical protein